MGTEQRRAHGARGIGHVEHHEGAVAHVRRVEVHDAVARRRAHRQRADADGLSGAAQTGREQRLLLHRMRRIGHVDHVNQRERPVGDVDDGPIGPQRHRARRGSLGSERRRQRDPSVGHVDRAHTLSSGRHGRRQTAVRKDDPTRPRYPWHRWRIGAGVRNRHRRRRLVVRHPVGPRRCGHPRRGESPGERHRSERGAWRERTGRDDPGAPAVHRRAGVDSCSAHQRTWVDRDDLRRLPAPAPQLDEKHEALGRHLRDRKGSRRLGQRARGQVGDGQRARGCKPVESPRTRRLSIP